MSHTASSASRCQRPTLAEYDSPSGSSIKTFVVSLALALPRPPDLAFALALALPRPRPRPRRPPLPVRLPSASAPATPASPIAESRTPRKPKRRTPHEHDFEYLWLGAQDGARWQGQPGRPCRTVQSRRPIPILSLIDITNRFDWGGPRWRFCRDSASPNHPMGLPTGSRSPGTLPPSLDGLQSRSEPRRAWRHPTGHAEGEAATALPSGRAWQHVKREDDDASVAKPTTTDKQARF